MRRICIIFLLIFLGGCSTAGTQTVRSEFFPRAPARLVAWNPFNVHTPTELAQAVADRVYYLGEPVGMDHWQHPRYTYESRRGDCEDHAILLMVALWDEGYTAYVVSGKTKRHGFHAITVVLINGVEHFLDATNKEPALRTDPGLTIRRRIKWIDGTVYAVYD